MMLQLSDLAPSKCSLRCTRIVGASVHVTGRPCLHNKLRNEPWLASLVLSSHSHGSYIVAHFLVTRIAVRLLFGQRSRKAKTTRLASTLSETAENTHCSSDAQLVNWVTIKSLQPVSGSEDRLEVAHVPDPKFCDEHLDIVVRSGDFKVGERGLLVSVGSIVPEQLATMAGWDGLLKRSMFMVKMTNFGRTRSHGLLLRRADIAPWVTDDLANLVDTLGISAAPTQSRRFLLELCFVGTGFYGSENTRQEDERPTVVGEVQRAVARMNLLVDPAKLQREWRTLSRVDVGVHARSFVLMSAPLSWPQCRNLEQSLNAQLPKEIRALSSIEMPSMVSIRYTSSVVSREYRYFFPVTMLGDAPTALEDFKTELYRFEGEHCFANFTLLKKLGMKDRIKKKAGLRAWAAALSTHKKSRKEAGFPDGTNPSNIPTHADVAFATKRRILKATVASVEDPDASTGPALVEIRLIGTGFLFNMIRYIAGTAAAVARGDLRSSVLRLALQAEYCVDLSEHLAPAHGLTLYHQELKLGKWATSQLAHSTEAADHFFDRTIKPTIRASWQDWLDKEGFPSDKSCIGIEQKGAEDLNKESHQSVN